MEQKELTIRDVLVSAEFITRVEAAIKALQQHRTKAPPPGMHFKHSAYDVLNKNGYFSDLTKIIGEFALMISGTSALPASQRTFIAHICAPCFNTAKDNLLKQDVVNEPTV